MKTLFQLILYCFSMITILNVLVPKIPTIFLQIQSWTETILKNLPIFPRMLCQPFTQELLSNFSRACLIPTHFCQDPMLTIPIISPAQTTQDLECFFYSGFHDGFTSDQGPLHFLQQENQDSTCLHQDSLKTSIFLLALQEVTSPCRDLTQIQYTDPSPGQSSKTGKRKRDTNRKRIQRIHACC